MLWLQVGNKFLKKSIIHKTSELMNDWYDLFAGSISFGRCLVGENNGNLSNIHLKLETYYKYSCILPDESRFVRYFPAQRDYCCEITFTMMFFQHNYLRKH